MDVFWGKKVAGPPSSLEAVLAEHGLELERSVNVLSQEQLKKRGVWTVDDIHPDCVVILRGPATGKVHEVHLVELKEQEKDQQPASDR